MFRDSPSSLIGTNKERKKMRDEVDAAYQESLRIDSEKRLREAPRSRPSNRQIVRPIRYRQSIGSPDVDDQKASSKMEEDKERRKELREKRTASVSNEPSVDEDHVVITVRHPIHGSKVRLFKAGNKMVDVYNWAGSLGFEPEHFQLVDYRANLADPDHEVISLSLNMIEVVETFIIDLSMKEPEENNDIQTDIYLKESHRVTALHQLSLQGKHIEVSSENVFTDLISHYHNIDVLLHDRIHLSFSGEFGVGDGVTKDVYAKFFDEFYKLCEGDRQKVPLPTIDDDDIVVFGKIVTHAFIQHRLLPLQLAKASLEYALYENSEDSELISTFLMFLPKTESAFIEKFEQANAQPVLDILTEYKIFEQPTSENITRLCKKAANVALIRLPCFGLKSIVKGMGQFWSQISREMFCSLYSCILPNPERVINALFINERQQTEAKIGTWLHRFIRNCTSAQLFSFVRFVTGSPNLWPDDIIKVEFVDQPTAHLRPTCFKILRLPRQYVSYTELSANIINNMALEDNWAISDTF